MMTQVYASSVNLALPPAMTHTVVNKEKAFSETLLAFIFIFCKNIFQ